MLPGPTIRLGLLKEAVPKLQRVAMLWNAKDLGMTTRYEASAAVAKDLSVAVLSFGVGEPNDFGDAFEAMERDKPDGLLMVADALTFLNRKRVFDFAAEHRLPAIYETSAFVRDGGLMYFREPAQVDLIHHLFQASAGLAEKVGDGPFHHRFARRH